MPRLFTGLEIPSLQTASLQLVQSGVPGMRWIDPSDMHITLRFIGDVSPRVADDIVEAFQRKSDLKPWKAPLVCFSNLSFFGSKTPNCVYAGVELNEELQGLQAGQERLMQQLGLAPDGRRYTPHVTLGRCSAVKSDTLACYLGQAGQVFAPSFMPARFVLYSAKESTGGGPYSVEGWWALDMS